MSYEELRARINALGMDPQAKTAPLREALACEGMTAAVIVVAALLDVPRPLIASAIGAHPDKIDAMVNQLMTRRGWEHTHAT